MEFADYVRNHCKKYGYSGAYTAYWLAHIHCEVGASDGSHIRYSAAPHHIRTRGAGGDDRPENLLALCTDCHTEIHQMGTFTFARRHPSVRAKARRARRFARVAS